MRTFAEIRSMLLAEKSGIMKQASNRLSKEGLQEYEKIGTEMVISDCQSYIANIDELTTIEIGSVANSLISAIQTAYQFDLSNYWQNFEKFAEQYIVGITPDGKFKNGQYFGQAQCYQLGIGVQELSACFKGRDPMNDEAGNLFRTLINTNYGTNIPMAGVEQQAVKDYNEVAFGDDQVAIDKAFVNLKEIQRDTGFLKYGWTYHLLATDQKYQEAKARITERNL